MTRVLYGLVAGLVAVVLAGCTGGAGDPSGESSWVETPVVATPTPQWTDEEEAAIEAVQEYVHQWAYIGQNLGHVSRDTIRELAWDPEANNDVMSWAKWQANGWHLDGDPMFEPSTVQLGAVDYQGQRYHVYGCMVMEGVFVVDSDGQPVGADGHKDRGFGYFTVIEVPAGAHFVLEQRVEDGEC